MSSKKKITISFSSGQYRRLEVMAQKAGVSIEELVAKGLELVAQEKDKK